MSQGDLAAIFGAPFDPNQHEPMPDYEPIPPGKYQVMIEKAAVKVTKAGDGHYIALEMIVVNHPSCNNRRLFDNINVNNPSQQCMEIGRRTLSALTMAANIPNLQDTSQLVNANVIAHVKVREGQNNVRTYSAVQQDQPGGQPVVAPPAQVGASPQAYGQPDQPAVAPVQQPVPVAPPMQPNVQPGTYPGVGSVQPQVTPGPPVQPPQQQWQKPDAQPPAQPPWARWPQ